MSYRNPQQYGIVEDMTAGTRAFQKGFGQVQGVIEKNKKEREDEEIRRDTDNAAWVKSSGDEIKKLKYISEGYKDMLREMITKDVGDEFFDKKSKTKQALLKSKLDEAGDYGDNFYRLIGEVKSGKIELDNPAMMKVIDSIEKNPKYALDKDNDPTLNGIKISILNKEMKENYVVTGSQKEFDTKFNFVRARVEKDIKQFEAGKDREITEEEKLALIQKHVTYENMVGDPSSHFVYKNIMTEDDKKDNKFNDVGFTSSLTGDKLQVGYSSYNYNGAGLKGDGKDNKKIEDFEAYRDGKINDFYVNKMNETLIDPNKPVNYSKLNYNRSVSKDNEKAKLAESEAKNLNDTRTQLISRASPFMADGKKAKSDKQLSKDYAGVAVDGLPGMPTGANFTIRSVEKVIKRGGQGDGIRGQHLVKFNFGKMSGQTDLPSSKVFDLNDPDILRQLQGNMAQLKRYGSFSDKLVDSFVGRSENKDANYYMNLLEQ